MLTVSTAGGGDVGFIECAIVDGTGMSVSGIHGRQMKESIKAA